MVLYYNDAAILFLLPVRLFGQQPTQDLSTWQTTPGELTHPLSICISLVDLSHARHCYPHLERFNGAQGVSPVQVYARNCSRIRK